MRREFLVYELVMTKKLSKPFYQYTKTDLLTELDVEEQAGLSTSQASRLLAQFGPNMLQQKAKTPRWHILLQQFASPLIIVLMAATVVSSLIGDIGGGVIIMIIVLLNAIV